MAKAPPCDHIVAMQHCDEFGFIKWTESEVAALERSATQYFDWWFKFCPECGAQLRKRDG